MLKPSLLISLTFILCLVQAFAIPDESNNDRWEKPTEDPLDAEVPGFLINLGPTGARGILQEKSFVVKYIFKGSPASGVLKLDDEIIGANGKKFSRHTFGGPPQAHGHDGPIHDLGMAIEDSEGSDGVLKLMIKRSGATKTVRVHLERLGRFSTTFPKNCKKTKLLKTRAYKFLRENKPNLLSHGRAVSILALLSSDNPKDVDTGKKRAKAWFKKNSSETWSWVLGFQAITLSEYYLLTKDRAAIPYIEDAVKRLYAAQYRPPNIRIWISDGSHPQSLLDKHQALYEGGFGHSPYKTGSTKDNRPNGYGPMQRPTYIAVVAWQLARLCGIKVNQNNIDMAFKFITYGTTKAGLTGYGGEFTMNNGPIDTANWMAQTRHGNSHKSGMAYMVYMLTPDREDSGKKMELHLKNIRESYKDMAHGHACSMLGLAWGWAGLHASKDEALKKKVMKYYISWLNMSRCHGSQSYISLPGRDPTDGSYYRASGRQLTTASVALLYSYAHPKLQIQGVRPSIMGIDPLKLTGTMASIYKDILDKRFGSAAKKLSKYDNLDDPKSKPGKLHTYIEKETQKLITELDSLNEQGFWLELSLKLNKHKNQYAGTSSFDKQKDVWEEGLKSTEGKDLIKAGKLEKKELIGQAYAIIEDSIKDHPQSKYKGALKNYQDSLLSDMQSVLNELKETEKQGSWHALEESLKDTNKKFEGISTYDAWSKNISSQLKSKQGSAMIKAHKLHSDHDHGEALSTITELIDSKPNDNIALAAKALQESINISIQNYINECQVLFANGRWNSLKESLQKNKSKLKDVEKFEKHYDDWNSSLSSKAGRYFISADKYLASNKIGMAYKSVESAKKKDLSEEDLAIAKLIQSNIEDMAQSILSELNQYESDGDWYMLSAKLIKAQRTLSGSEPFDSKRKAWIKDLRKKDAKRVIEAGKAYMKLENSWKKTRSGKTRKALKTLAKKYKGTLYAEKAEELVK